jgi:hypothetical protein
MQTPSINQRLSHQYEGFVKGQDIRMIHDKGVFTPFGTLSNSLPNETALNLWQNTISPRLVLGKRVEHFMSYYLENNSPYKVLAQNIQIFNKKTTIGELDFIIQDTRTEQIIHLEQVYKFYLYVSDANLYQNDPWIGPNYKDSFQKKMDKLTQKQFPLLYQEETMNALAHLQLDFSKIQQHLSFKAALFLPFDKKFDSFETINNNCIEGTWMHLEDFEQEASFHKAQFFIPEKQDWGLNPKYNSIWFSYTVILSQIQASLRQKRAPLCWLKTSEETYKKIFIVWW